MYIYICKSNWTIWYHHSYGQRINIFFKKNTDTLFHRLQLYVDEISITLANTLNIFFQLSRRLKRVPRGTNYNRCIAHEFGHVSKKLFSFTRSRLKNHRNYTVVAPNNIQYRYYYLWRWLWLQLANFWRNEQTNHKHNTSIIIDQQLPVVEEKIEG